MRIFSFVFLLSFAFSVQQAALAQGEVSTGEQFLACSAMSKLKIQLMQNRDDPSSLAAMKPDFSFTSNISSDDASNLYKDRKKAFFRSLILPGAGEHYLGKKTLAKTFFFTEITLWLGYFGFREYSRWVRDDALAFAATHSGAVIKGKPSQFFVDIGNYHDIYQYNDAKQRFFQFDRVYADDDDYWAWDSDENRNEFENMRIASDQALNRSVFVLGGIFANHIISAIHAVWQTSRHNKKIKKMSDVRVNFYFGTDYSTGNIIFSIQKIF